MKTLCIKESSRSAYAFEDDVQVCQTTENTIVGDPVEWIVGDLNIENSALYEGVELPSDWKPQKYLFDGVVWVNNPDYVEPVDDGPGL